MSSSHRYAIAACALVAFAGTVDAAGPAGAPAATQEIVRAGTQPSVAGSVEFFTGRVRVDPVWPASDEINPRVAW